MAVTTIDVTSTLNKSKYQSGYFYSNSEGAEVAYYTIGDTSVDTTDSIRVAGITSVSASQPTKLWVGVDTGVSIGGVEEDKVYIVSGAAGDEQYEFSGAAKGTQINAGAGNDSVSLGSGMTVTLGSGADLVSLKGTGNTATDYNYEEDRIAFGETSNLAEISVGNFTTSGGIRKDSTSESYITVNTVSGKDFYAATLSQDNTTTDTLRVAWGGKSGSTIDLRGDTASAKIFGTANGTKGDLIIGSDQGDSIIAGANDSVFGGSGNDSITISGNNVTVALFDQNFYGKITGADSVQGFKTGWESTDDTVYVMNDDGMTSTEIGTDNIVLHATEVNEASADKNRSSMTLYWGEANADSLNLKVNVVGTVKQYQFLGGEASENSLKDAADVFVATATKNENVAKGDSINVAKGTTRTAVNLSNWGNDFIGDTTQYLVNDDAHLVINAAAATQDLKIVGSANTDSIVVGSGNSSVWGGFGGDDSIQLGSGTADVFFGTSNGNDTVKGLTSSDTITLYDTTQAVSSITESSDTVTVKFADESSLTLDGVKDSTNVKAQIGINGSTMTLQIGGSDASGFTANKGNVADYYYVTQGNDTASIKVTSDENTSLWLAGSVDSLSTTGLNTSTLVLADETAFTGLTMSASSSKGDVVLAGSTTNDTIYGSTGHSTLFGGAGNDLLIGDETGKGITTFLYGKGMGNDEIWTNNTSDKITLYDVAASDIASYQIDNTTNGALTVTLTDGSTLTVNNFGTKGTNTITTTDHTYTYDYTTDAWTVK